ncbi:MAG: hypothetical protein P794_01605 [Epsilonproteobacteria bacterium (ex Lamellibrachia satsuma)]|nr:MAG: hypothetical protein P794_01605 [Epsilonproteobacteria bacterium (ex Lamellibrachia satsuma)]
MAVNIRGNRDGDNGHNESYTILGRGTVSRPRLVREVKSGKHPNHTTIKISGIEYVKAKPDNKMKNNVNR